MTTPDPYHTRRRRKERRARIVGWSLLALIGLGLLPFIRVPLQVIAQFRHLARLDPHGQPRPVTAWSIK